jgi:hypothetical protein
MGAIGTQTVDTSDRLAALRKHMVEHKVDAYIVPSEDQRKSQGPSDLGSSTNATFLQISASTLPSAISVGHSFLDLMALRVRLLLGPRFLLILILFRHCDCDKGPSVSFYGWTLLSSGGESA